MLTCLSHERSIDDEENEYAYAAVRVDEFLQLNVERALRREGWPRSVEPRQKPYLLVTVLAMGILMFVMNAVAILCTQPRISVSKPGDYNLKGTHPIAAGHGNAKFLRRIGRERPCITPVFSSSNPSRNFSISACTIFGLEEAHTRDTDTVNTIKIGSWFHEGGGDHIITFGNARITIKTKLLLYGVAGGTRRLLFSMLYEDYLPAVRYLHELVMYGIMEETCTAKYATRTCDEVLKEHRSESTPTNRTVVVWTTRKEKRKETVVGLETNLFLEINKPWVTVFKRVGPLLTAEQVTEVKGPGCYSHTETGEREQNLHGLLVQETRFLGVFGMTLADVVLLGVLLCLTKFCQPLSLSQKAWDLFENRYTSDASTENKPADESSQGLSPHNLQLLQISFSGPVHDPRNSGVLHSSPGLSSENCNPAGVESSQGLSLHQNIQISPSRPVQDPRNSGVLHSSPGLSSENNNPAGFDSSQGLSPHQNLQISPSRPVHDPRNSGVLRERSSSKN
ncbi:hypothetical protein BWQ96_03123 [Gracilariopsis chorda]|uniref:Uncharacterized protein n=1 Tax=Gracilariopsis chorda TaxID=448386 RepID=A0A2V3IY15_9FLOR|nr:hypothetical protein BWQ96_03123 [Gracilariopsis chorda]|eukprot:PXF47046.1 hypothetical protein BWQ96_03123 [Gracilariopsis chorda]